MKAEASDEDVDLFVQLCTRLCYSVHDGCKHDWDHSQSLQLFLISCTCMHFDRASSPDC